MQRGKGLARFGARLRSSSDVRIAAFGGTITYDGYYLAALARMFGVAHPSAVIETATRGLPGFASERSAFRAQSIVELKADLTLIEFAFHDGKTAPEQTARAVEGIVRQLRAKDPEREIVFVYFGDRQTIAEGKMREVVAAWERVADHYSIPAFDGIAAAEELVANGTAVWFRRWPGRRDWDDGARTIALTHDGGTHTAGGGSLLGGALAQAILSIINPETLTTIGELRSALDSQHWGDARMVDASSLSCAGWVGGPLSDDMTDKPCATYFDRLVVANDPAAKIRVGFVGRYLTLWAIGTGGRLIATVDGRSQEISPAADWRPHPYTLLNGEENRTHAVEIEARSLPVVLGGLDLLGRVTEVRAL